MGLVFAILLALGFWYILRRMRWGYEIRVLGENPLAAQYAGMSYFRSLLWIMFCSGGIAGIAGAAEVSGLHGSLQVSFAAPYGFTAIIVAWLARLNPFISLTVSVLFGAMYAGGEALQIEMGLPLASTQIFQGLILFFVLGGAFFNNYRLRLANVRHDQPTAGMGKGA
jgi:simple sugar transport system permease protein